MKNKLLFNFSRSTLAITCALSLVLIIGCNSKVTPSNNSSDYVSKDINSLIYGDSSTVSESISSELLSSTLASEVISFSGSLSSSTSISKSNSNSNAGTGDVELYKSDKFKKFSPTLQMFVGQFIGGDNNYPAGETPNKNTMYNLIEKHVGIKCIPMFTAPWGAPFNTKIKAQIASNNIPDLSFCQPDDLALMIKGAMISDLTPYIQKYASPSLKALLAYNNGVTVQGAMSGGKIYGIPKITDAGNGIPMVYIRKDYMQKAGVSAPKSLEDLVAIAKAFKSKGLTTIGIPMSNALGDPYNALMNAYGAYPAIMQKDSSGKLIYTSRLPATKTALGKIAQLVKDGVVDPNFATKDYGSYAADITSGKAGIYIGQFWHPLSPLSDTVGLLQNGVDWNVYAMPKSGGGTITPYSPINTDGGYFYIRKGFKNPEALIILLNYMVEGMYNQNSDLPYVVDCTKFVATDAVKNINTQSWLPVMIDRPDKNIQFSINVRNAIAKNDTKGLTNPELLIYNQCISSKKADWAMRTIYLLCEPVMQKYTNKVFTAYTGAPTKTMSSKGGYLGGKEVQMFTAIMAGTAEISTFDDFVTIWTNNGGSQILAEVN